MPVTACFSDLEDELALTRRMLERYPDGKGSWRPHAKSRTLAQLANHVAGIPGLGASILTSDELDLAAGGKRPLVDTAAELLAAFDAAANAVRSAFSAATDDVFKGDWTMRAGERVIVRASRRALLRRMMINHMVHHRAQLGDCYRLLDVPVPGMYGPSADD